MSYLTGKRKKNQEPGNILLDQLNHGGGEFSTIDPFSVLLNVFPPQTFFH